MTDKQLDNRLTSRMSVAHQRANEGLHVLCYCLRRMYKWKISQKWHLRVYTMYLLTVW